jgi:hypothetical protein
MMPTKRHRLFRRLPADGRAWKVPGGWVCIKTVPRNTKYARHQTVGWGRTRKDAVEAAHVAMTHGWPMAGTPSRRLREGPREVWAQVIIRIATRMMPWGLFADLREVFGD